MTSELASAIYTVLVKEGGALESERSSFIYHNLDTKYPLTEWRFCGHLGFGGKYWTGSNTVSCYSEDSNPKREKLIEKINKLLIELKNAN